MRKHSSTSTSDIKIYIRRIMAVVLTLAIFSALLVRYYYFVSEQDNIYILSKFIPKNTADVLIMGSSHVYDGINPSQLYEDYGIAAYDLCSPNQPPVDSIFLSEICTKASQASACLV